MLNIQQLKIGFHHPVKGIITIGPEINFTANEGELNVIIGPNGIGKTTLLRTLLKLQPAMEGEIFIDQNNIKKLSRKQLSTYIAYVSTEFILPYRLSVYELIALGRSPYTNWIGKIKPEDVKHIEEAIDLVGISYFMHKDVWELSDGEKQKAMIARAIAQDTPIIILDEPTAYLDLLNKHQIFNLLADLAHKQNKTIILTTHDLSIALNQSDKILLLLNDKSVTGAPEDLIINNSFTELFNKKYHFDIATGTIKRKKDILYPVALICTVNDSSVIKATKKALERLSFKPEENSFIRIEITKKMNSYCWVLSNILNQYQNEFTSIYDLCRQLNKQVFDTHNNSLLSISKT